jgi:transcriptional regulator with XRE-family HTH domain
MDKNAFGKRIREVRKKAGVTTAALAEICDVSTVFIQKIESGKNLPALQNFVKICSALNVSADYLLRGNLPQNKNDDIYDTIKRLEGLRVNEQKRINKVITTMLDNLE